MSYARSISTITSDPYSARSAAAPSRPSPLVRVSNSVGLGFTACMRPPRRPRSETVGQAVERGSMIAKTVLYWGPDWLHFSGRSTSLRTTAAVGGAGRGRPSDPARDDGGPLFRLSEGLSPSGGPGGPGGDRCRAVHPGPPADP